MKNLNGKGIECQVGLQLLYFFSAIDESIILTNDRKQLLIQTWDEVKKYISNGGKIIASFKKLKDAIEKD